MESTSPGEIGTEKTLDQYIYDYLVKRNMGLTALIFRREAGVSNRELDFDGPESFLSDWWSFLYDIFFLADSQEESQSASASSEAGGMLSGPQQWSNFPTMQFLGPQRLLQRVRSYHSCPQCVGRLQSLESTLSARFSSSGPRVLNFPRYDHRPGRLPLVNPTGYPPPTQHIASWTPAMLHLRNSGALQSSHWPSSGGPNQSSHTLPLPFFHSSEISPANRQFGSTINNNQIIASHHPVQAIMSSQQNSQNNGASWMDDGDPNDRSPDLPLPDSRSFGCTGPIMEMQWVVPLLMSSIQGQNAANSQFGYPQREPTSPGNAQVAGEACVRRSDVTQIQNSLNGRETREVSSDNLDPSVSRDEGVNKETHARLEPTPQGRMPDGFLFHRYGSFLSEDQIHCCDFSPDGSLLAFGGQGKTVRIWSRDSNKCRRSAEDHGGTVTDARFCADSKILATSSLDRTVKLWNLNDRSPVKTFTEHRSPVLSVDFHPQKIELVGSCDQSEMRLWSAIDCTCLRVYEVPLSLLRFQPGAGRLMATAWRSWIYISDVQSGSRTMVLKRDAEEVRCLSWDPEGKRLAAACDGSVKVWSMTSGQCVHEYRTPGENQYPSCIFHPVRPNLLVFGGNQTIHIWDMGRQMDITIKEHAKLVSALAGMRVGEGGVSGLIASAGYDDMVYVWHTR